MAKTLRSKEDLILIRKDAEGKWRWTRKTSTNHKIVGASTEGYTKQQGCLDNIERTQKEPFITVWVEELPQEGS